ncbi:MAG: hypothetical protein RKP20_05795 [Candidatus Competibacter sp.]|nr:hypothetical protein [Candidatus Competibacter sp.]
MESHTAEIDEGAAVGMPYVLKEEALLAQAWKMQDRVEHERGVREIASQFGSLRQRIERLRAQTDTIWERFVTLTLERILSEQLREFIDDLNMELQGLNLHLVETDCEIDRMRARIRERRRWLGEKFTQLESLAHRTSTQNHINMMLARVEGLEAYLLGKKDVPPQAFEMHYKRHTTVPSDLLYLRIRLLTTRIASIASNRSRQLNELDAELGVQLPEAERLKAELATLVTRVECMSELSRYWLAYLDISLEGANREGG